MTDPLAQQEVKWKLKEMPDPSQVAALSTALKNMPLSLAAILIQRGITDFEQARTFFRPEMNQLEDHWSMKDMEKAVDRITQAIEKKQKVLLIGDYDVDGTTSTAMLSSFLKSIKCKVAYYIPDRYKEGYGVSSQAVEFASENDFSLIISLDCGIKAVDKVDLANKAGIDFIICDHHTPGAKLPEAIAVLDPKQTDCSYPYKELSGCGVAFKLMQALAEKLKVDEAVLHYHLDLLATSIAADIVPITGENRVLAAAGLEKINRNPSPGISVIKDLAGLKSNYTIGDIVFKIAPRINSAGRMASGKKAVDMLAGGQTDETKAIGDLINTFNLERRDTDKAITSQALEMIDKLEDFESMTTTVLYSNDWHKGVIGIVASRMIEHYYRPTVIFSGTEGKLSGSARSVKGFDIYAALEQCSDVLIQFGGHKYAAGMTLEESRFDEFRQRFDEVVKSLILPEMLIPSIEVDAVLPLDEIDGKFFRILQQFAPFGPGNMNPVFKSSDVIVNGPRKVGEKHLKFSVFSPEQPRKLYPAIAFGLGHLADELTDGSVIELVYALEENSWQGRREIQLNVKDIRC